MLDLLLLDLLLASPAVLPPAPAVLDGAVEGGPGGSETGEELSGYLPGEGWG